MAESRLIGGYPVIGIRPCIDGRRGPLKVRESLEVQTMIADGLGVPLAEVYGVVTFYTQFSLNPKGEYKIAVCLGTACYVKGSGDILDKFKELAGIDVDGCTPDGKFSLEATRCIGACGLAPVFTVNEDVYGRLKEDGSELDGILAKYRD